MGQPVLGIEAHIWLDLETVSWSMIVNAEVDVLCTEDPPAILAVVPTGIEV